MFRKGSVSLALLLFGFALAQEKLPEPWQVEKKRIEEKYKATVPELKGEPVERKSKTQEVQTPKVKKVKVYEINQEILKEPKREVLFGMDLRKKKEEEQRERQKESEKELAKEEKGEVKKEGEEFYATCVVDKDVEVSLEERKVEVPCLVITQKERKLTKGEFLFIPAIQEYKLIAKALRINGKEVDKAQVLDARRGTVNVADEIDTQLISKILLRATQRTGEQVSGAVENVLSQAGTTTISSAGVVHRTDVNEVLKQVPKASIYLGLANLLSSTSEEVFKDKKSLPVIFKVRAGKELDVKGVFK